MTLSVSTLSGDLGLILPSIEKGVGRSPELRMVFFSHSPCFEEEERFRVLVKMSAQELANGVPDSGHLYASLRASRTLTPVGDLQETFSGMDQVTSCVFQSW